MREFLRKREEELHTELEDKMEECVTAMQHNLTDIQAKAAESREMEQILQSAPQIPQPQYFLQVRDSHFTSGTNMQLYSTKDLIYLILSVCMAEHRESRLYTLTHPQETPLFVGAWSESESVVNVIASQRVWHYSTFNEIHSLH